MYQVTIKNANQEAQAFVVSKTREEKILVNDTLFEHDLIKVHDNLYHIIHRNQSYQILVLKADTENKTFTFKINQKTVQVEAKDKFDLLLEKLGVVKGAKGKINHLKAPMPGAILDIKVTEGQSVKKGDALLILEAMKMENIIKSPVDAVIKTIKVDIKQNVEKGHILIQFE